MTIDSSSSTTLRVGEWVVVALACGLLGGLTILTAWRGGYPASVAIAVEQLEVTVSGAVAAPGAYRVPKDGAVAALLALAQPLPHADLTKAPKVLGTAAEGWRLCVPSLLYVEVELQGALVTPGIYKLPVGTRLCDLVHHVELTPQADMRWLKRHRRLLHAGDQIVLPIRAS